MTPTQEQLALQLIKSVGMRFLKGALSGAAAAVVGITLQVPSTWHALSTSLIALVYVAVVGFLTGGILAVEKYYNWTDIPPAA